MGGLQSVLLGQTSAFAVEVGEYVQILHADPGGVRHGGWPIYVNGHRPSLWPMTAREWPALDIRSGGD